MIILFLLMTSICSNQSAPQEDNSYQEVMVSINEFSQKIKTENQIKLAGYGLHYAGQDKIFDGKIHEIDLSYCVDKHMEYEEARKYFYSLIDELINRINNTPELAQYFSHYPISYNDFHFSLSFDYHRKGFLKQKEVASIHIRDNKITYFIIEKDGELDKLNIDWEKPGISMAHFESKTRAIVKDLPEKDLPK